MEELKPRKDYKLRLDIAIDACKTQISNFNVIANRAGVGDQESILAIQDELVKIMEKVRDDVTETDS